MSKTPSQRAEACFAIARSTSHDGERAAAIGRGEAICRKHGLDLDAFRIPGRQRQTVGAASLSGLSAAINDYRESLRAATAAANARADEHLEAARRRNFDLAAAEAKMRDAQRQLRRDAEEASHRLFQHEVRSYPGGGLSKRWMVFRGTTSASMTDAELIELAAELADVEAQDLAADLISQAMPNDRYIRGEAAGQ